MYLLFFNASFINNNLYYFFYQNMPNIDLLRIVLINIAEENLDELLANYNQKHGFDLSQHLEYFYSLNKKVA